LYTNIFRLNDVYVWDTISIYDT